MKIEILGVNLDQIKFSDILEKISAWQKSGGQHFIATVNAEFIVAAQKDYAFKEVLNRADLAICDGMGPAMAAFFRGQKLWRVSGADLAQKLLENPDNKIYLLGGREGITQAVAKKYPGSVVGAESGGRIDEKTYLLENNDEVISHINQSRAEILLVAFGQVKQEMWIDKSLPRLSNIKVAMGVGGTLDYLSGQAKRAPKIFRLLGLEWLFRLMREPRRVKRIYNATVKFIWLFITKK